MVSLGTSIVAGCGFATTLLKVVLIRCSDAAQLAFPEVSYFVYVDDSDFGVEGDRERIEATLPGATKSVVHYLENVLHCPVSREKSVCLASISGLRRSLALTEDSGYRHRDYVGARSWGSISLLTGGEPLLRPGRGGRVPAGEGLQWSLFAVQVRRGVL